MTHSEPQNQVWSPFYWGIFTVNNKVKKIQNTSKSKPFGVILKPKPFLIIDIWSHVLHESVLTGRVADNLCVDNPTVGAALDWQPPSDPPHWADVILPEPAFRAMSKSSGWGWQKGVRNGSRFWWSQGHKPTAAPPSINLDPRYMF